MRFLVATILSVLALAAPAFAADKPLVIVMNHEPETLDATKAINGVLTMPSMINIEEDLIGVDAKGNPAPGLATWKIAPDGMSIDVTVRPGVKFQSGDPFTARDIVFSHERMATNPIYKSATRGLDHVALIDDQTARFYFKHPDVTFLVRRALIIVSKAYHDRVGEAEFVKHPVGTGPYKLVKYQPAQAMELEAFDGYWGGAPSVKHVRLEFVNEGTTRVAKLRSGEADIILNTPYTDVEQLKGEGFKMAMLDVTPTTSVGFIKENPHVPWHDIRVREGVAHAIDADAIVKGLFRGIPKHYAGFAPGQIGYDPSLKNYTYDPALAKKLLAEAGFAGGFKMPLTYWIGEDYGMRETAEAVALYLKAVGIECAVQGMEVPKMVQIMRKNAKHPELADTAGIGPTPYANYYEPIVALNFVFASSSPFSTYRNPAFDKLVGEAIETFDVPKRAALVRQAGRILHDDYVMIPIWNGVAVYAMKKNIDFRPTPHQLMRMEVKDVTVH